MRVTCPSKTSCAAGTDSRVYAPCWPRVFGKLRDQLVKVPQIEERTFEQLQVVNVLAFGEVKLVPQERVRQRVDCMKMVPKIVLQGSVVNVQIRCLCCLRLSMRDGCGRGACLRVAKGATRPRLAQNTHFEREAMFL